MSDANSALIKSIAYLYEAMGELANRSTRQSRNIVTIGQCAEQLEGVLKLLRAEEVAAAASALLSLPNPLEKDDAEQYQSS